MTSRRDGRATPPTRQSEQARLVEEGRRLTGVADALDVFERAQGRANNVQVTRATPRYATGGNG